MSMPPFTVRTKNNGDIDSIVDANGNACLWSDADFQTWNAAQATPATLSISQQLIQQGKQMTFAQFQSWYENTATVTQKERILYELLQRALRSEIV